MRGFEFRQLYTRGKRSSKSLSVTMELIVNCYTRQVMGEMVYEAPAFKGTHILKCGYSARLLHCLRFPLYSTLRSDV